jgi:opacity protein-like surface antigen
VSNTEHLIGYAIGAGIDTKLMSNTSFGVEAMYYGFNGDSYNYSDLGISGTGSAFISTDDDRSAFVIRAKLASFF